MTEKEMPPMSPVGAIEKGRVTVCSRCDRQAFYPYVQSNSLNNEAAYESLFSREKPLISCKECGLLFNDNQKFDFGYRFICTECEKVNVGCFEPQHISVNENKDRILHFPNKEVTCVKCEQIFRVGTIMNENSEGWVISAHIWK